MGRSQIIKNPWVFPFDSHTVRVVMDEKGDYWFVAVDVCAVLGIANSQDSLSRLDDDEKGVGITDTLGGVHHLATVNESGLWELTFTSRRPAAKRFRKWVTSHVIPTIRKTNSFTMTMAAVRQAVAERFLSVGLTPWVKRFPDNFYREIFRLHGWPWDGPGTPKPGVVAYYTLDLIYARLATDLVRQLQERNPANEKGHRRAKHHQYLSEDVGHPELERLLYSVIAIMKSSKTWADAMLMVDRIHPRWGNSLLLSLMDDLLPPPQATR